MSFYGLGKIILLGEHAVVYGYPALAAALDRGVRVSAVPTPAGGALRVDIPSWNLKVSADDDHQLALALAAIAGVLEIGRPSVTLVGEAQIPPGAGLGASAAFGVAIARALIDFRDRRGATPGAQIPAPAMAEVMKAANASEQLIHGRASGVDAALAATGGIGVFRKAGGLRQLQTPALRVIVGPSGAPRATAAMVERVAQAVQHARVSEPGEAASAGERRLSPVSELVGSDAGAGEDDARLRELGDLTDHGTRALLASDLPALGRAMDRSHALLGQLGVSTPLLDGLCEAARRVGAYGAKLTGAGGGGAVIAIAPREKEADVLAAWRMAKVDGFVAKVGG